MKLLDPSLHLHGIVGGPRLGPLRSRTRVRGGGESPLGRILARLEAGGVFGDREEECVRQGDGLSMEPVDQRDNEEEKEEEIAAAAPRSHG
ncbi:hypothetical protein CDL15_Pgr017362 [Punica granatum]|uniref:Uncharacterized protein n=1 Tax=Punica granatum TaxID=22663 RepID=A0A218Y2M9_PUNGR|nr:hypothetical protein CDL15_Pgr017362 [Punica granatum]